MNLVCLTGRTTADVEKKENGAVSFTLAVKEGKDKTYFLNCAAFEKTGELISSYVKKGDLIGVTGKIKVYTFEKDGKKNSIYSIVVNGVDFLSSKKEN